MLESEREKLNELNRELMVLNGNYEDLKEKLSKLGKEIFKVKVEIDNKLNGKET